VILKNGKPEHELSKHTWRQSAQRQQHQALARPPVASSLFKSRVLNPIHLNQVSKYNNDNVNVKEEDSEFHEEASLNASKDTEKHQKKTDGNKYQHGPQQKHCMYIFEVSLPQLECLIDS
jgi:hypothetical protein